MLVIHRRAILASLAATVPLPVRAADPWTRPPSTWTQKDIERILTDSPWARQVSITLSSGMPMGGGGRRGGRGGGAPMGGGMPDASVGAGSESSMGGMGGMGGRPGMGEGMGGAMAPSITFQIRWQSAKPIKLATVRARMGAEADTSPQAREFVEREEPDYVIAVIGPPMGPPQDATEPQRGPGGPAAASRPGSGREGQAAGGRDSQGESGQWMAALKENTWLAWKQHDRLHPTSVTTPPGGPRGVLIFHFPKDHPIELEDREVEFCMRRGPMEIRKKFRLKDMVYEGRLSL